MEHIPSCTIVFRAIRKRWLDQGQQIQSAAFMLRIDDTGKPETGLSLDTASAKSCASVLKKCAVASLHVGRIRSLGLDVVPDEPGHANILGMPDDPDKIAEAEHLAGELAKQARYVPPEKY
jgi:hypothetical protein